MSEEKGEIAPEVVQGVRAHFAALDERQSGISERLAHFVVAGDDAAVLKELAGLKTDHSGGRLLYSASVQLQMGAFWNNQPGRLAQDFLRLAQVLPRDAQMYVRLARVYEIAATLRRAPPTQIHISPIPGCLPSSYGLSPSF
jgi:hypothetical protein